MAFTDGENSGISLEMIVIIVGIAVLLVGVLAGITIALKRHKNHRLTSEIAHMYLMTHPDADGYDKINTKSVYKDSEMYSSVCQVSCENEVYAEIDETEVVTTNCQEQNTLNLTRNNEEPLPAAPDTESSATGYVNMTRHNVNTNGADYLTPSDIETNSSDYLTPTDIGTNSSDYLAPTDITTTSSDYLTPFDIR